MVAEGTLVVEDTVDNSGLVVAETVAIVLNLVVVEGTLVVADWADTLEVAAVAIARCLG